MNSHIQLPKQILNQFRDETRSDKKVCYLDIPTGEIFYKSAGLLGTAPNYFSRRGEHFWDRTVESSLGVLTKKVRMFCSGESDILNLTQNDIFLTKRYIKAAAVRSGIAHDSMMKNSFTAQFCSDQENHDDLSAFGMKSVGMFDYLLEELSFTIMVNKTERSLVVPRNCFYTLPFGGKSAIVAPISPKAALFLLSAEVLNVIGEGYAVIDDSNQIAQMNLRALVDEYIYNGAFVASNCKSELLPLQQYLGENRRELELSKAQT